MLSIRVATIDDLEDLTRLFDAYRVFYEKSSDMIAAKSFLQKRISNNESIIYIAFIDNNTVGFTQIYPLFSSVSMQRMFLLNDLYVDPQYRCKGIGEALLNRGKQYTIENNGKSLILETAIDNPAQHLYERLGWTKDTEYLHYSWSPE